MLKIKGKKVPFDMFDGEATFEHISLNEAWKELSHNTFGVWVCIQNLGVSLDSGLETMQKHLGLSYKGFRTVTKELERKGYIHIERTGRGKKNILVLLRRAVIYGDNSFVKLSKVQEMVFKDYVARLNHKKEF